MPSAASASWKAARWSGSSSAITPSKSKTSARGPRGMGASYSRAGRRWPTTARLHRIPGLHEDDLPPTAVERADRRSGAPRVAALAGGRAARRPGAHRPDAGGPAPPHRGGVRVAHAHGPLHGLRSAAAPLPGARRDAPPLRPRGARGLRGGQARRLHLEPDRRVRLRARGDRDRRAPDDELAFRGPPALRARAARPAAPVHGRGGRGPGVHGRGRTARPQDRLDGIRHDRADALERAARGARRRRARAGAMAQRAQAGDPQRRPNDTPIQVTPGDRRPLGALSAELITVTPGQKVAYVVDPLFSPANAAAIVRLAAGADLFFCEAPFLEEDLEQAAHRYHLTARQAGALARAAGVRRLQVFHFSPRYEGRYGEIVSEAQAEFAGQEVRYGELDRRGAAVP